VAAGGRFFFDLLLGAARLMSGKYNQAIELALASLRQNAMHAPAHRLLVIALSKAGRAAEAAAAGKELLRVDPKFRVSDYEQRYPGRGRPHADGFVRALRDAGLPY
jgi:tetratricopeptide (TPR) repeat protein